MPKNSNKRVSFRDQFTRSYRLARTRTRSRIHGYMNRRPHRTFRRTRRRDYLRSLQLPGYLSFTHSVNKTLWRHKRIFLSLAVVYGVLSGVLVGIGSQETYASLTDTLQETGSEVFQGNFGEIGKAGLLFASIATSGLTGTPSEAQQIYSALLVLLVWLTTVWLLRNLMAGHAVRVRDGLYSSGSPLVSTFLVSLLLVVQLLPLGLAIIGYSAASATGLLTNGVEAMLFWLAAGLLATLSLYWISATFFAMIIVTLPGMYPWRAIHTAGDMVVGRRVRILARLLWMLLAVAVTWALVLVPTILLDTGLKNIWSQLEWIPIIPIVLLLLSISTVIWSAGYVYLLYRKVVDDDAAPA